MKTKRSSNPGDLVRRIEELTSRTAEEIVALERLRLAAPPTTAEQGRALLASCRAHYARATAAREECDAAVAELERLLCFI